MSKCVSRKRDVPYVEEVVSVDGKTIAVIAAIITAIIIAILAAKAVLGFVAGVLTVLMWGAIISAGVVAGYVLYKKFAR